MAPTVVVLGAGPAGLPTAHKLLKYTAPKVRGLKVILVDASTHFYFNPASVRGIIPGEIPDEGLFHPIKPGFDKYPSSQFEFVQGKATKVEPGTNTVEVETAGGVVRTLSYDQLVVATGSSTISGMPFKNVGTHEETMSKWHSLQDQVKAAKSITVAGAGPTGAEVAGELGAKYGRDKTITLVADDDHILPGLLPSVRTAAEKNLGSVNVSIVRKARVVDVQGKTVHLSTGKTLTTDLYIPAYGVRPNTSFIPPHLLDQKNNLKLERTLRVEGLQNVWGVGDVGNLETKQLSRIEAQVILLAANLDAVLTGDEGSVKEHKPSDKPGIFVTMGKKTGVGQLGSMKVFTWIVSMMKGKGLFLDKAPGIVSGKLVVMKAL